MTRNALDPFSPLLKRKLLDLQQRQAEDRKADMLAGSFREIQHDELNALKLLCCDWFGDAKERFLWVGGPEKYRYGGLLEFGPEEIGIVYMGFYVDPPSLSGPQRRRWLVFRGAKISEFEAQGALLGFVTRKRH